MNESESGVRRSASAPPAGDTRVSSLSGEGSGGLRWATPKRGYGAPRNWPCWLAIVVLTSGAFALYMRYLGRQSLWFDEGLSVLFAARPLPQLFRTLIYEDLHPPLYYLLLHFWMALVGSSELAVRMPSLFAAVLLVPLSFAIVREIWSQATPASLAGTQWRPWQAVGMGAAALVGTSPFIAYYAQETRMYSLAAMLVLATTLAFLRATASTRGGATRTAIAEHSPQHGKKWWFCFSCLLAASLYTQYFSAFVIPAFPLYAFLLDRQWLRRTVLHILLAGLLYVPWVVPAYLQLGRLLRSPDYWVTTRIDPVWFARSIWRAFLPNIPARVGLPVLILGGLALVGLLRRSRLLSRTPSRTEHPVPPSQVRPRGPVAGPAFRGSDPVRRTALVLLTVVSPVVLTYVAVSIAPKFATRYSIIAAAPLYICAAMALYALLGHKSPVTRGVFALVLLAAVAFSLRSTAAVTAGRENPRDDARGLAAYLTAHVRANDALLLVEAAPYALQYYYRGAAPWYGLHVGQDVATAAAVLNQILQTQPGRIWLILWHHEFADPMDMVVTELLRVGREVDVPEQFLGYRLRAFDIVPPSIAAIEAQPKPQVTMDADFGSGLRLLGFDRFSHNRGWLHYVLYWQAQQQLGRNYSLTLNLEDSDGNEYLRQDQALSTPYFLPPAWPLQMPIRGRVDVFLPADLPAVTYRVHLRVLDPETQRNLDVLDAQGNPLGQALLLEELALSKGALATAPVTVRNPFHVEMSDHLQLLGYDLANTVCSPGDAILLTLWWQSTARPVQDHQAQFRLLDGKTVVWESRQALIAGYSTTAWDEGEINRGVYRLSIPPRVPPGEYSLQVGTEDGQIALAALEIAAREHRYDIPPMQQALGVEFESGIVLLGYDLYAPTVQPGATITVTLYWQARQPVTASYKVTVQLLAAGPRIVMQDDSIPAQWTRPTTGWLPREIITDEHVLSIPSGTAPGTYTLITALYQESTLQRLRIQGGSSKDYVTLTTMRSEP